MELMITTLKQLELTVHFGKWFYHIVQGVSTQTFIFHFALADRNMQDSFGLKVIWESWIADFLVMTLRFGQK